jgi:hypothetical protein
MAVFPDASGVMELTVLTEPAATTNAYNVFNAACTLTELLLSDAGIMVELSSTLPPESGACELTELTAPPLLPPLLPPPPKPALPKPDIVNSPYQEPIVKYRLHL